MQSKNSKTTETMSDFANRMGMTLGFIFMAPLILWLCCKWFSPPDTLDGCIVSTGEQGVMVQYVDEYGWKQEIAVSCKDPDSYVIGESVVVKIHDTILDEIVTIERT